MTTDRTFSLRNGSIRFLDFNAVLTKTKKVSKIIRLIFFQEHLASYRVAFFSKLAKRTEVDLTLITAGDESGLEYGQDNTKVYPFKWIRLPVLRLGISCHRAVFFKGLWKVIHDLQPQVIIMSSNYRLIQAWSLYAICKIRCIKILCWGHGFHHQPLPSYLVRLERCLLKFIGNYCVDGMLVYANDGKQYLQSIGIPRVRIFTFNNTLDIKGIHNCYNAISQDEIYYSLKHYGIQSSNCLTYIGRMVERKAPQVALYYWKELLKYLPESQLIMIGDGPLLKRLSKQTDKSVVFTGSIYDEKKIACIMRATRAIFCPSSAGLNINHAFAYGKPLIVMNRDDHGPEITYVRDGFNGLVLPENALNENIDKLLKIISDDDYQKQLCEGAWQTGSELTMEKMVNRVIEAIKYVMN